MLHFPAFAPGRPTSISIKRNGVLTTLFASFSVVDFCLNSITIPNDKPPALLEDSQCFTYAEDGLDRGIGHFTLFEVDSKAGAPAPLIPISPQTSSAASDRKSALLPSSRQGG